MTDQLTATPVIKDKFWVVEHDGQQIGSIQAREDGGFAYVHDQTREYFPTIRAIKRQYNIRVITKKISDKKRSSREEIYGFPCHSPPYGEVFDVKRQLPIYSLNDKSKSYYCAGYYLVNYSGHWQLEFCPKLISINRYKFIGPFVTKQDAEKALNQENTKK